MSEEKKEPTRSFIRGLWGVHDNPDRYYQRRHKMDNDIKFMKHFKYNEPFRTYVFGEDNYKYLVDQGFDCRLVDKKPIAWDMEKEQFRHKLECFKQGMDDFDEVVFLDWDCLPIKALPDDFWDVLRAKGPFQAILRGYKRRKAMWRKVDQRKIPCASFVYINDPKIPQEMNEYWEELGRPWSEEVVMMRYMERMQDGWKGPEAYWEQFEPDFFVLGEGRVFDQELLDTKNKCFHHFNAPAVRRGMKSIRKGNMPDYLQRISE
jgi:hypothetical protein